MWIRVTNLSMDMNIIMELGTKPKQFGRQGQCLSTMLQKCAS